MTVNHAAWQNVRAIHEGHQLMLGPRASFELMRQPDHVAMVLARYRAAAALIGTAQYVLEVGCGEGFGAGILAKGRRRYVGIDPDEQALQGVKERAQFVEDTMARPCSIEFAAMTTAGLYGAYGGFDAVVCLDVIEHVPADQEAQFMFEIQQMVRDWNGVVVIGTPNASAQHLASPASKAGHINLYSHDRLLELMRRYFRVVQSFGMQDTSLHSGHPEMRHYLLMAGFYPRVP